MEGPTNILDITRYGRFQAYYIKMAYFVPRGEVSMRSMLQMGIEPE